MAGWNSLRVNRPLQCIATPASDYKYLVNQCMYLVWILYLCMLTELPYNDYFEYYGPDFKLHISPSNMANQNTPEYLDKIKARLFENMRMLPHTLGCRWLVRTFILVTTSSFTLGENFLGIVSRQFSGMRFLRSPDSLDSKVSQPWTW